MSEGTVSGPCGVEKAEDVRAEFFEDGPCGGEIDICI